MKYFPLMCLVVFISYICLEMRINEEVEYNKKLLGMGNYQSFMMKQAFIRDYVIFECKNGRCIPHYHGEKR